jgi:hypothetical protein
MFKLLILDPRALFLKLVSPVVQEVPRYYRTVFLQAIDFTAVSFCGYRPLCNRGIHIITKYKGEDHFWPIQTQSNFLPRSLHVSNLHCVISACNVIQFS